MSPQRWTGDEPSVEGERDGAGLFVVLAFVAVLVGIAVQAFKGVAS